MVEQTVYARLLVAAEVASLALHEFHPWKIMVGGLPVGRGLCDWRPCKELFEALQQARAGGDRQ